MATKMTSSVTLQMVSMFTVASKCVMGTPCQHDCTITLSDGRKQDVKLLGSEIESLLHFLKKPTQIKSVWGQEHFKVDPEGSSKIKAQEILSRCFK